MNFLKITYRNFIKHKSYSLINILGLSIGLACAILFLAYIGYEFSFDRFHENADQIYRVAVKRKVTGKTSEHLSCPAPLGPAMVSDFPEVLDAVRFFATVKRVFKYKEKSFFQTGVIYADKSVFNVFSFKLIEGDPETALQVPFTMVLTRKTAKKYFGDENPMGKKINWDNKFDYTVTGIVEDPPANSHFTFEVLASFSTFIRYDPRIGTSWRAFSFSTYLLLRNDADYKEFEKKFAAFNEKYFAGVLADLGGELDFYLQPLTRIHLHSHLDGELGVNSDIKTVYIFAAIALVILLIACINFMNLTTARSENRAKEVGLRKVLGAERKKLVFQFLGESFVYAFISLFAALILARAALPYFVALAGREISVNFLKMPLLMAGLAGIVCFVGLAAGSYPAFFLSAFKPVSVLRRKTHQGSGSSKLRSLLVVFQFLISIILIVCTIIILNQHNYMKNKDLGFNKKNLLVIALQNDDVRSGLEAFKNEVLNIAGVTGAGASSMVPGEFYLFRPGTYPEGFPKDEAFPMENFLVDYGYFDTLGIEIVAGRGFTKEMISDRKEGVLINETTVKRLEWKNPVGKTIDVVSGTYDGVKKIEKRRVIGVFKDIHQRSLYDVVEPTFTDYIGTEGPIENRARRLVLRLKTSDISGSMKKIEQKWQEMFPDNPYFSFFLDEFYDNQHRAEGKLGGIFRVFALLAVFVGCLGLFGLASFTAEKRTKEIGIRKVFGSTVAGIVVLLCKDFIRLIVVANAIAWPIAYFAMKKWLQDFPYPAAIGAGVFIITALLTLLIALLTVSFQSVKAARTDPVKSLRYE